MLSQRPKLKVTDWTQGYPDTKIRNFEEARDFLNLNTTLLVTVEGEVLVSYNELVRLANKECHHGKIFLKVELVPLVDGG